jgi:cytochrome d ubiquinol oxidase subunit II
MAGIFALFAAGYFIFKKQEMWAFILIGLNIIITQITFFTILYPRVMISSTSPLYNLTIYNASSTHYTLTVMTIVALIFVPIILIYQGWTYYIFRKRISTDPKTLTY